MPTARRAKRKKTAAKKKTAPKRKTAAKKKTPPKRKPTPKKKTALKKKRLPPAKSVEPGDEIYVLEMDLHPQYRPISALTGRGLVSGLVCTIRKVQTGKPAAKATGKMSDYVFEILESQPSDPALGGARNAGRPEFKAAIAQALKKAGQAGKLTTDAVASLRAGPLAGLDGWRIVRLVASEVYTHPPLAAGYSRKAR